jgi:hypothetical protein
MAGVGEPEFDATDEIEHWCNQTLRHSDWWRNITQTTYLTFPIRDLREHSWTFLADAP